MTSITPRKPLPRPGALSLSGQASNRSSTSSSGESHSSSTFSAISASSVPSSASSYASSFSVLRPLPTPPIASCSTPRRLRPLPTPPRSPRVSTVVLSRSDPNASAADKSRRDNHQHHCPPLQTGAPKSSLRLDTQAPSTEMRLATPVEPLTPISFTFPECTRRRSLRRKREDEFAARMQAMGFVEVNEPQNPDQTWCSTSEHCEQEVVLLVEDEDRGTDSGGECEVEVRQESSQNPKRLSRKWMREARGTRWVEEDYCKVLESLRKLR